jgi:predicted PilT family ATPase
MAATYESMKQGLTLVEQEMPASISFHVPDQYHKRIIGIGGQHIQRIMKKHSVFVKFSNAMDRGNSTIHHSIFTRMLLNVKFRWHGP